MTRETLRRLARRELAPREIAEAVRHVRECAECAKLAEDELGADADGVLAMLVAERVPEAAHPDHSELTAYADNNLGPVEREIVESHLDDCAICRTDVADLRALQTVPPALVRPRGRRPWRTAVTLAAAATIAAVIILQRSDDTPRPADPRPQPPIAATDTTATTPPITTTTATSNQPPEPPARYANAEWERLVRAAITTATLPFPPAVSSAPDTLRGNDDGGEHRVSPAGVVIDETRPRFTWPASSGASYVVSIFAGEEEVAHSEPLTSTGWKPPKPLPRGRDYVWQVEVTGAEGMRQILPAPPDPPATFRVISKREHDELIVARAKHPDDHVLHAVLAARAGLRADALAALRKAERDGEAARLVKKYR